MAQQWSADVYAGGTRYAALGAQAGSSAGAVVGNLRLDHARFSAFASGAVPFGEGSPGWAALGGEWEPSLRAGPLEVGIDLAADGFAWRLPDGRTGQGASTRATPFVATSVNGVRLRVHGGRHDYVAVESNSSVQRHLVEVGARASASLASFAIDGELKMLTADGRSWPFAGVQLARVAGPVTVWGGGGRWFGEELQETVWNAGVSYAWRAADVWAAVQHIAGDPLFLSPERATWNVGVTVPIGGRPTMPAAIPEVRDGHVVIRLERSGRAARGPIHVAGQFNDWAPAPMQQNGGVWEISVPASGVLRFAFVDAAGEWFVPEGYPGRMSDDMGGHIVVMVVP